MDALTLALFAAAGLAIIFSLTFIVGHRADNYGCVDVAWSYSIGLIAVFYAYAGAGWWPRRLAIAVLTVGWSARLGTHILRRLMRTHPHEDPRYHELRQQWKGSIALKMFAVFQLQAVLILTLGLPLLFASEEPVAHWRVLEVGGAALWLIAIAGESVADRQLAKFKADPTNQGKVCAVGLWKYSRHPNYFCEWLVWLAAFIFALPSPGGIYGAIAPVAMLVFLAGVTGIPPTERQSVRSKGDLYRQYQRTTSAFVPWIPRAR